MLPDFFHKAPHYRKWFFSLSIIPQTHKTFRLHCFRPLRFSFFQYLYFYHFPLYDLHFHHVFFYFSSFWSLPRRPFPLRWFWSWELSSGLRRDPPRSSPMPSFTWSFSPSRCRHISIPSLSIRFWNPWCRRRKDLPLTVSSRSTKT